MIVKGKISHGVLRGEALIERYYHRLRNVLGFAPFKGTLNVQIEKPIDIRDYELKRIEHVLMSGRSWIDIRLAPATLFIKDKEKRIKINCWIIREDKTVHYPDMLEIITKENIREKCEIRAGDEVEIEIHRVKRRRYEKLRTRIKSIIFRGNA